VNVKDGTNTVSITTTSPLTGTIAFNPGSKVLTPGTTGDFAPLIGDAVVFPGQANTPPTALNFNTLTSDNPFLTIDGLTFSMTTENPPVLVGVAPGIQAFVISGTGLFHEAGFTDTPGSFDLSTQSNGSSFTDVSFSASALAVPGPIVGAGLPGLLTMLAGGGWLFRRRRNAPKSA
jgi:hypothetical protein